MTHMPDKKPTDAKIVKSLMKFEESFNVFLAAIRHGDRPTGEQELDEAILYDALGVTRRYANDAQARIDGFSIAVGDEPSPNIGTAHGTISLGLSATPEEISARDLARNDAYLNMEEIARTFDDKEQAPLPRPLPFVTQMLPMSVQAAELAKLLDQRFLDEIAKQAMTEQERLEAIALDEIETDEIGDE